MTDASNDSSTFSQDEISWKELFRLEGEDNLALNMYLTRSTNWWNILHTSMRGFHTKILDKGIPVSPADYIDELLKTVERIEQGDISMDHGSLLKVHVNNALSLPADVRNHRTMDFMEAVFVWLSKKELLNDPSGRWSSNYNFVAMPSRKSRTSRHIVCFNPELIEVDNKGFTVPATPQIPGFRLNCDMQAMTRHFYSRPRNEKCFLHHTDSNDPQNTTSDSLKYRISLLKFIPMSAAGKSDEESFKYRVRLRRA